MVLIAEASMARLLLLLCLVLLSCKKGEDDSATQVEVTDVKQKKSFFQMSTITNVVLYHTENDSSGLYTPQALKPLWRETDSILYDWNSRFTTDSVNSEIYAINHRKTETVDISKELFEMLTYVRDFNQIHPGLFDPTIGPLKSFWKPTCAECKTPTLTSKFSARAVDSLKRLVNFEKVQLLRKGSQYSIHFTDSTTTLEIGGVAKGFILNSLSQHYKRKGYSHFVISMGGDIYAVGGKPSGKPFTLGIQSPDDNTELTTTFNFKEGSVVTSGNYERYRIDENGDRVHHIYSLKTGYPAKENKSVTIVAPDPTRADIYSTALFSLPADSILQIVEKDKDLECYIIDMSGNKYKSKGFFHLTE